MAGPLASPARPLTNQDKMYKEAYFHLCDLYRAVSPRHKEAHDMAWELYQDPVIPLLLRCFCCSVLGEGKGDYLTFAQEGVKHAETMLAHDPENKTCQNILEDAQQCLRQAEKDHAAEQPSLQEAIAQADQLEAEEAVEKFDTGADETSQSSQGEAGRGEV